MAGYRTKETMINGHPLASLESLGCPCVVRMASNSCSSPVVQGDIAWNINKSWALMSRSAAGAILKEVLSFVTCHILLKAGIIRVIGLVIQKLHIKLTFSPFNTYLIRHPYIHLYENRS